MAQYTTQPITRLIVADSETNADLLWSTGMFAPDPFIFIASRRKKYVVMNDLEFDRARAQADVDVVLKQSDYVSKLQKKRISYPTTPQIIREVLRDLSVKRVLVPSTFPIFIADQLRKMRIAVDIQADPFWPSREIKTESEIENIRASLVIAEKGMDAGMSALRRTTINKRGYLYLEGSQLTSERLKSIINSTIMEHGCVPSHTIVASGEQATDPHNEGSGPIKSNTAIIIDIFPRSQKTGYYGDITRTVVRGQASERLKKIYESVKRAQKLGIKRVRHGASPQKIHNEILEHFRKDGFKTGFYDGRMQGFFHGTGHGLGLEVHEAPSFGSNSRKRLKKNHVVTVEPGLYYSGLGGVRLEDAVSVTNSGCVNLVSYPKVLEL